MPKLEATFKIITPMFLSGADACKAADRIRPPSVKGALRFWWRALQWTTIRHTHNSDEEALKELHRRECALFGAAAHERHPHRGQSSVLMRVSHDVLTVTETGVQHPGFRCRASARYLGFGLMAAFGDHAGRLDKACINEGQTFTVTLLFRDEVDDSLKNALLLWGLLGGLGKRVRRGLGSVAIQLLKVDDAIVWRAPVTLEDYDAQLKRLLPEEPIRQEPPYSTFSDHARVDRLLQGDSAMDVLENLGNAMLMYRGWGHEGRLPGGPAERRFENDHHWFKEAGWRGRHPGFHPERVVFGLPHNYGNNDYGKVKGEVHERRASPLLFHVHQLYGVFVGVSVFLPSMFLPAGERINAGGSTVDVNVNDWRVITGLLDGRVGNPPQANAAGRFPDKEGIWP